MLKSKKLCLHHLDIPLVIPKSSKTKCFHKKCGFAAKYTLRDFSIISPFVRSSIVQLDLIDCQPLVESFECDHDTHHLTLQF